MARKTIRTLIYIATLTIVGFQDSPAQAQGIFRIVPRIAMGVGRALFGPWDRYYYAGRLAYPRVNYPISGWRYYPPAYYAQSAYRPYLLSSNGAPDAHVSSGYQLGPFQLAGQLSQVAASVDQLPPDSAQVVVSLPADAKLYVNGKPTNLSGDVRRFFSRNLATGRRYPYEFRVEMVRNGQVNRQTKSIELLAGKTETIAFSSETSVETLAAKPAPTALVLHVPTDAKVFLMGNPTQATGSVRRFECNELPVGRKMNYMIRVSVQRNGKMIAQERRITLEGGRTQEQRFVFIADNDGDRVAEHGRPASTVSDQAIAFVGAGLSVSEPD